MSDPNNDTARRTGSCLCGAVRYSVSGPLREIVACHCSQCRRQSGHHLAATRAPAAALKIEGEAAITWYRASELADRGFCRHCGSRLFWRPVSGDTVAIFAGTLDSPTGLTLERHIFVADKGDYYEIADGAPQFPGRGS